MKMDHKEALDFFIFQSNVKIDFYGDKYGRNVIARYTDFENTEHGISATVGRKNGLGQIMTREMCVEECLTLLFNFATSHNC